MVDQQATAGAQAENEGRRKLLKLVVAAGSAAAAVAVLPGSWTKPSAHFGALPAHAQATDVPIEIAHPEGPDIVGVAIYNVADPARVPSNTNGTLVLTGWNIQAVCTWNDEFGQVNENTLLWTRIDGACVEDMAINQYPYFYLSPSNPEWTAGTLTFNVVTNSCLSADTLEWYLHMAGRTSNTLSGEIFKTTQL